MKNKHISQLENILEEKKMDSFLITNPSSIYYLVGFTGLVPTDRETYLLFQSGKFHLVAPKLYEQEALSCVSDDVVVHIDAQRTGMLSLVSSLLKEEGICGFESEDLKYVEYEFLKEKKSDKFFEPTRSAISNLRLHKQEEEVELIRCAQEITYKAYENIIPSLKLGMREFEIHEMLVRHMRLLGAEGESFPAIIAINKHSSLPHYKTGTTGIKKDDLMLLDFGAKYKGYCGDTTRMLFFGTPSNKVANTYDLVLEAQKNAILNIKSGTSAEEGYDHVASIFEKNGVLDHFTHGLGHGIGLDVHEAPYLRSGLDTKLEEGMVFSIEPGLYYLDWGGIRIEDLVVCRKDNVEVLGECSRNIKVLDLN